MMKQRAVLILVLVGLFGAAEGQQDCPDVTLGAFLEALKQVDPADKRAAVYKKYRWFDFKLFKPKTDKIEGNDFYEVGLDDAGRIKEVIRHFGDQGGRFDYKLLVYELKGCRVMLVQLQINGKFQFTPMAIWMPVQGEVSYLINTEPLFSGEYPYDGSLFYEQFPFPKKNEVSVIMELDKSLYPSRMLKLDRNRIVTASTMAYAAATVKKETIFFFLVPDGRPELRMDVNTCLFEIFNKAERPDMILEVRPELRTLPHAPLWILGGAHSYQGLKD